MACQHGFLRGKSCTSNLLEVLHHIGAMLDKGRWGGQVDTLYMDMSKAFDKVCHHRLLRKLCGFGFRGNLLQWFYSYLTDRCQRVTVFGVTSDPLSIRSGIPQGSILGQALFLLYVNDLPDAVEESNIAMFADNIPRSTKISNPVLMLHPSKRIWIALMPGHRIPVLLSIRPSARPRVLLGSPNQW